MINLIKTMIRYWISKEEGRFAGTTRIIGGNLSTKWDIPEDMPRGLVEKLQESTSSLHANYFRDDNPMGTPSSVTTTYNYRMSRFLGGFREEINQITLPEYETK